MNTPDKKPEHPADKGKTHDTTRDPQPRNKETGYPPVNDPTGGPRRDEQQR